MRWLAVTALLAAGCATAAEEPPVRGGGRCDAAKAERLLDRPATAELGAEALRLTGATSLRWIAPGDMVTMDYREDRVNLRLSPGRKVVRITCG